MSLMGLISELHLPPKAFSGTSRLSIFRLLQLTLEHHFPRIEILREAKPADSRGEFDQPVLLRKFGGERKQVDYNQSVLPLENLHARRLDVVLPFASERRF